MFCSCGEKIQILNVESGKVTQTISQVGSMCTTKSYFVNHNVEIFSNVGK